MSGEGLLYSFTVFYNVEEGQPHLVIGLVELIEQEGLIVPCNLSSVVEPEKMQIGTPMKVWFEVSADDLYIPQFSLVVA